MKTRWSGAALTLLCLVTPSAFAQAMTAGDLQQICMASDEGSKMACKFYILGVTQGISAGIAIADRKTNGGRPCVPNDTSGTSLELAIKMKMGQDLMVFPDDRKLDASGLLAAILVKTFPCGK